MSEESPQVRKIKAHFRYLGKAATKTAQQFAVAMSAFATCGNVNPRTGWVCDLSHGHGDLDEHVHRMTAPDGEQYTWRED